MNAGSSQIYKRKYLIGAISLQWEHGEIVDPEVPLPEG